MPTTVVHIADAYKQDPNWKKNPDYVYVGRARGDAKPSLLGNPYAVKAPHPDTGRPIQHGEAIELFKERRLPYLLKRHPYAIYALKGKILVCFCGAGRCHGDCLATTADTMESPFKED
jgi:hypothetical protein